MGRPIVLSAPPLGPRLEAWKRVAKYAKLAGLHSASGSGLDPVNGVQEVAGSNPVAPTCGRSARIITSGGPLFLGGDHLVGNSVGNPLVFWRFSGGVTRFSTIGHATRYSVQPSKSRQRPFIKTNICTTAETTWNVAK